MIPLFSILVLGFFLGMRHAADPDHVAAVTTIVSRQRTIGSAALTGIYWGIGHSLTLIVVGGGIIFFGIVIPERLGLSLEFCVALMLILLGAFNLRAVMRFLRIGSVITDHPCHQNVPQADEWVHSHPHDHGAETDDHSEASVPPAQMDRIFDRVSGRRAIRPIVIGVVHGLAGSAALPLLVLPIIQRPLWALAYLFVFGVGTIAGMMFMTATIAVPITYTARFDLFQRYFGPAAGVLSLGFGLFLAYQVGFVDGLFTH